jgi:hypothetical protein
MDFLGYHISAQGVKANTSKVDKILNWPVPKNMTAVRSFLGLVRYIACFLPQLANFMHVLTPLTTKEACREFFEGIKALVFSPECLVTIDHNNLGDNKVYVTCDASD